MVNGPIMPVHTKGTIYDERVGNAVRVFLNGGGQSLGVLHSVDLDKAVLNPSLINYSTAMVDECRVEERDTIIPYHNIMDMQDIERSYLERICRDIAELDKINRMKREVEQRETKAKLKHWGADFSIL